MNGPRLPEHYRGHNPPPPIEKRQRYSHITSEHGVTIVYDSEAIPSKSTPFQMSTKESADEIGSRAVSGHVYVPTPISERPRTYQEMAKKQFGNPPRTLADIKANNQRLAIFHASEDMIDAIKLLLKEGKTETAVRFAESTLARAMPPHLYK